jgi:16S rRNA (guanine966-N2)-methyltransferase
MKITGGQLRRRKVGAAEASIFRPTARRLRETLFEFLTPHIKGARFLDLCAGSGTCGIEALSRGAAFITFVEAEPKTCTQIEVNLRECSAAAAQVEVVRAEATSFLDLTDAAHVWDIAFYDPPYATDYAPVLTRFSTGAALRRKGSVLVVEHHCDRKLADKLGLLHRWRLVWQGQSCLSFYERRS